MHGWDNATGPTHATAGGRIEHADGTLPWRSSLPGTTAILSSGKALESKISFSRWFRRTAELDESVPASLPAAEPASAPAPWNESR